jgi:hypothetical protein
MSEHSPLPWIKDNRCNIGPMFITDDQSNGMLDDVACTYGENREADAALIVRAVNAHADLVAALGDLHQKAGAIATWLNHWDVPFAAEDEYCGPTGDKESFFDALNKAAAALAKVRP